MKRILSLIAVALVASTAQAGPTSFASVPLLNLDGTGTVKPNLMLLYDNSGSMLSTFTPDYVDDSGSCRSKSTLALGSRGCVAGDPPFMASDFNKQYYNPKVRYLPPVTDTGGSYKSMTRENTTNWTSVTADGFGVNTKDLLGADGPTNLASNFPDISWCSGDDCRTNTVSYTYPNDVYNSGKYVGTNPYYYTINVAEYCSDDTLTNCQAVGVGQPAPAGFPVPAPVRWCDSTALTNCQAKYVGNFKYPRFSDPNSNPNWYGTVTIRATATANKASILSVQSVGSDGAITLTNYAVTAATGTDTADKQAATANALALSIIKKTESVLVGNTSKTDQYTACVRTSTLSGVPACSKFGITLENNSMVAVVPVSCPGSLLSNCTVVNDGSRSGRGLVVNASAAATAILTVSGKTNTNYAEDLYGLSLGGTQMISRLTLAKNLGAASVASAIAQKIGTSGTIKAYVGGTSGTTPACEAANNTQVCLIGAAARDGQSVTYSNLTNNTYNGGKSDYLTLAATQAIVDGIPTNVAAPGATVFVRTDIVSGKTFPKADGRTDCAGTTCTYDEEMTNFANWYAYYKTRNQMMKTSVGHAFQGLGSGYRIGIVSLSTAAAEGTISNKPQPFVGTARKNWYNTLYGMQTSGSTPLRQALHAIGKMYANQSPYNYSAGNEVVTFPCQRNFTFMTTDGYWNGAAAADVVNNDNTENAARFCSLASGCVDPAAQSDNSLADVALYWYNGGSNDKSISLRDSLEDWSKPEGAIKGAAGENTRLHMVTYALGLGVDGIMKYTKDYDTSKEDSDFRRLVNRVTSGCPWNGGKAYVWPDPQTGENGGGLSLQSRVDDLWHAAVNGHGKYFSASDRTEVIESLQEALSHIDVKVGAAAAAATSTPNVSLYDNDIFAATFTTVKWSGELQGRKIDPITGNVKPEVSWNSSHLLGAMVSEKSDTRTIYMLDVDGKKLKPFIYSDANMTAVERGWFNGKCSLLSQCSKLKADESAIVNKGETIVNWLRGQQQYADGVLLRAYSSTADMKGGPATPLPIVLGDVATSKPAYLRDPRKAYTAQDYFDFKTDNADRKATVFVGANDGMLHAFEAADGTEMWAYAPRITMKKLYKQADLTYGTNHQFTVDGSPELGDVKINGKWRTVLVSGMNTGGRGYFALDVTDPDAPAALWELCADATVCSGDNYDKDIGLTLGNPQFGTWKDASGTEKWVVFLTSGYNNIPGTDGVDKGDGKSYLYVVDIATGKVLSKTAAVASTDTDADLLATPPGLARITAISANPNTDPRVTFVYGGDNLGRMWRFDFTTGGDPKVLQMGSSGVNQPITTRPDVTLCEVKKPDGSSYMQRVVAFGTGRMFDQDDIKLTNVQSAYVLADTGVGLTSVPAASMPQQKLTSLDVKKTQYAISGTKPDFNTHKGWYVNFDQNLGERVNLDPKIVGGALNIVTNVPSSKTSCDVGGTSKVYQLNVCTGAPLIPITVTDSTGTKVVEIAGQNLSDAGAVGTIVISLPSGERKQITTNADGSMVTTSVASAVSEGASRAGWRRVRD